MQEGMVGALAAEGAGQHQRGRAALQRRGDGQFAVGLVLFRRKRLARHGRRDRPAGSSGTESKSPTQSSGMTPSGRAWPMPASAAMTRAPATWRVEPRRADEIAAKQDGESAHVRGPYQPGTAKVEGAGCPHGQQTFCLRRTSPGLCVETL